MYFILNIYFLALFIKKLGKNDQLLSPGCRLLLKKLRLLAEWQSPVQGRTWVITLEYLVTPETRKAPKVPRVMPQRFRTHPGMVSVEQRWDNLRVNWLNSLWDETHQFCATQWNSIFCNLNLNATMSTLTTDVNTSLW